MTPAMFETERPRMTRLAYTLLGSFALAEEVVQDAWLKAEGAPDVCDPGAWLTTVVSRLALDELRSARARREVYPGPWLPEPVRTDTPEDASALAEAVQMATMVVLERLTPHERAAFLLREVFDMDYPGLAVLLGRSEPATRKLVSRSKATVARVRRRPQTDPAVVGPMLGAVMLAIQSGDLEGLKGLLAESCSFTSDGGGKVLAATQVVKGADRVARLLIGLAKKFGEGVRPEFVSLNHQPGLLLWQDDMLTGATVFTVVDGLLVDVHQIRNPDKLNTPTLTTRPFVSNEGSR